MNLRKKGINLIAIGIIATLGLLAIIGIAWAIMHQNQSPRCDAGMTVTLGQEFTIGKNCFVKIKDTNLEIGIVDFYNNPCPKDAQCIWSGLMVYLEYKVNGEVKKDINLVRDYGLQTRILESDYETYARLLIEKSESYYVQ